MIAGRFYLVASSGARRFVGGKCAGFGGHAEEAAHAFDALFIEDVVDVRSEVGANGLARIAGVGESMCGRVRRCSGGRDRVSG